MSIDLSNLNYKQLIELEKQIQKEKENKIKDHLTKDSLLHTGKAKEILSILDPKFQHARYGYPNKSWLTSVPDTEYIESKSKEEKAIMLKAWERAKVVYDIQAHMHSSMTYLCDIAFENYEDYIPKFQSGKHRGESKSEVCTIKLRKEIPWQISEKYKAMYYEIADIFKKYAKENKKEKTNE